MFKLLKKNFKFFTIEFLTILNENIFKSAIILLINYILYKQNTLSPQLLVLFSTLIYLIPQLLFSTTAGKICDKFNKNYLIKRLKTLELFVYSFALISIWSKNIILLVVSLFIIAIQRVFFENIKYSIIPEISDKQDYLNANIITIVSHFFALICGVIVSYVLLLKYIGIFSISVIISLSVICNYLLSKKLKYKEKIVNNSITINKKWNFVKNDLKNLLSLSKRKYIFLPALGIAWFWFVSSAFINHLEFFAKSYLNTTQTVAVFFIFCFVVGIMVGSAICGKVFKDRINIAFTPLSAIIITFLTYRIFKNNLLPSVNTTTDFINFFTNFNNIKLILDFALIGIFAGIYITPLYSFVQIKTKSINKGRIFAGINLLNYVFMILSSLICYILARINFYIIDIFLFIAIANWIVGFVILFLLPKSVFFMFGRWVFKLVFHVKVEGLENYQAVENKRIIVIANHQSFLDAALLSMFIDENLSFAMAVHTAKAWYFKPFMKICNCYTIDSANPMSLKSLINLSKSGKKIMIFPEGRITTTGIMMKIYDGPAMIATKANALLLPVRIDGAQYSIFSRLKNKVQRKFFTDIKLTVMPAEKITLSNNNLTARQRRVEAGNQLHKIMVNLFYSTSFVKETLFESLLTAKKRFGGSHKIVEDTSFNPQTYNNVILKSFVLGNYISKFTFQKEYLGILLPNAVANIILFLGMHTRDRIPVMLNFSAGVKNILNACFTTKIRYVFTSKVFIEKGKLENIVQALKDNGIKVIILEDEAKKISLFDKLSAVLYSKFPSIAYRHTTKGQAKYDDVAAVLFTSGSENAPKGVALSHINFNANKFQLITSYNFLPQDRIFCCLPLFHSFGLAATLISLMTGTKIFFYPSPLHYRIIPELIYRTNSTIMFATNTFLEKYAKFANPYDFYSLRIVAIGGEKLTENNRNVWIDKYSIRLAEGYGATECAPLIAFNSPMKYKRGTVGVLAPGLEYKLEKVEGIEEGGRLILRGNNVFKGYIFLDKPCEIVPPKDGWYDTGDIVKIDSEGYVTIIGRAKRFAKIGGEMVSMTMVENEIAKLWPNSIIAVINERDNKKGEKLVIITNKEEAQLKDIVEYFKKSGLPEISIPKEIRYIKDIPLLSTGKINYIELNKILAELENAKQDK